MCHSVSSFTRYAVTSSYLCSSRVENTWYVFGPVNKTSPIIVLFLCQFRKSLTSFITGPPTYSVGARLDMLFWVCRRLSSSVTLHWNRIFARWRASSFVPLGRHLVLVVCVSLSSFNSGGTVPKYKIVRIVRHPEI